MRWYDIARIARNFFRGIASSYKDSEGASSLYYYFDNESSIEISLDKIVVRVSNHGSTLKNHSKEMRRSTTVGGHRRDAADYQNYSFVFLNDGSPINAHNDNPSRLTNSEQRPFVVYQYIYRVDRLSNEDVTNIFNSVKKVLLGEDSTFNDPLKGTTNQCVQQVLTPNDEMVNWNNYNQAQGERADESIDTRILKLLREYTSHKFLITESRGRRIIRMNEQGLRRMVGYIVQRINEDTEYSPIRTINEKFYNPKREAMIDGKLGDYDVLDGALSEKTVEDLKDKGRIEDVRMYANPKKGGKTYALYRRCDNHKYFFAEIYDDKKDDKYLHARVINHNDVPSIILNDANSLIQRN